MPLFYYATLGLILLKTGGFYREPFTLFVTIGVLLLATLIRPRNPSRFLIGTVLLTFAAAIVFAPVLWYVKDYQAGGVLHVILQTAGVSIVFLLLFRGRWQVVFFVATLGLLLAARFLVLQVSPWPSVDVFFLDRQGANHLIAGRNPYTQSYGDMNQGKYVYQPWNKGHETEVIYTYWPAYLILSVPCQLLGDVRLVSVFSDVAACWCLWLLLCRRRVPLDKARWLVVTWAAFPVFLMETELAWIDNLLCALLAATALLLEAGPDWALGVALGTLFSTKQYAMVPVGVTLVWLVRSKGVRPAARVAGWTGLTVLAWMLPFALWNFEGLWNTFRMVLYHQVRADGFTVLSFLIHRGIWPGEHTAPISYLTAAAGAWWLLRRDDRVAAWGGAVVVALSCVFLLGVQAFCNYYFFVAFAALTWGALTVEPEPATAGQQTV